MRCLISLRRDGYDVAEANDGGRLLVNIAAQCRTPERRMDLLVSDIRMPVLSGLEILRGLREARWLTPVVLMTAFGDAKTRAEAEVLGAVLFDKPFEIDDLRTAVTTLLGPYP